MTSRDLVITGASEGYINPGGFGEAARLTSILDPDLFATRGDLAAGVDSMFRPNFMGPGLSVRITVQGLRTVANHAAVVDVMIPGAIGIIHQVTGRLVVEEARKELRGEGAISKAYLTGNTHDSVHARLETTPDLVITDVGPTTFYAPLIEFGLARHFAFGPRPFMTIAFSTALPQHLRALQELARIAASSRGRVSGPRYGPPTNSFLQRFRAFLYTAEKQVGDIIPFGGFPGLRGTRELALNTARALGDIQSVVGSFVGARFVRRLEGRVTGRLIGIGANTVFASRSIGASISGANRAYNRVAGKYMARFMGQNNFFRGGGV